MALTAAGSASETRELITRALAPAGTKSMTAKYLAAEIGVPVREVRDELARLGRDGTVRSKTHRSGEVLYRLKDRFDAAWDGVRSSTSLTLRVQL
jgi:predicted ArsR family transcriptional regulator